MAELSENQKKKILRLEQLETFAEIIDGLYGTPMGASGIDHAPGQVPDPGSVAGTSKYLREDGTWQVPYQSKVASNGGTDISLVTTGDKYNWNNKANQSELDQLNSKLEIVNANGHDYIEIGGIKWATMNVGANNITDTGLYFQWGDTQGYIAAQVGSGEGYKYFDEQDYKYINGSTTSKYNTTDEKTILDLSDDAVRAIWGGNWRTPTAQEYTILQNAVNIVFTNNYQNSGIAGLVLVDKTDSSKVLFFPAAGRKYQGDSYSVNQNGFYWINSTGENLKSQSFIFDSSTSGEFADNFRYIGFVIRGVLESPIGTTVTSEEKEVWNNKQDALIFNTAPSSSNKVATMADIPSSLPVDGGNAATVNNHSVNSDVPANAVFTDTTYSAATTTADGLMSASDKTKLNNIETGAQAHIVPTTAEVKSALNVVTTSQGKYLKDDGTWDTPPDTTYSTMVASGTGHAGGLVPDPPETAGTLKYLREDGTWSEPEGGYVPTLLDAPTSGTVTYVKDGQTKSFVLGQLARVAGSDGYDFYQLIDLTLENSTITATWTKMEYANTTYQISVNGNTYGDSSSGTSLGAVYGPVSAGTQGQVLFSNGSGAPVWANKPTYKASEVMSISSQSISANTSSSCSITGSSNAGKAQTIIYVNSGSADYTVTVPTTYKTPDGAAIELTCPVGGYCEVSYLNIGGTIYARGL